MCLFTETEIVMYICGASGMYPVDSTAMCKRSMVVGPTRKCSKNKHEDLAHLKWQTYRRGPFVSAQIRRE
jgi:hypothetical protein